MDLSQLKGKPFPASPRTLAYFPWLSTNLFLVHISSMSFFPQRDRRSISLIGRRDFSCRSRCRSCNNPSCWSLEFRCLLDLYPEKPCTHSRSSFWASHPSASRLDSNLFSIFLLCSSITPLTSFLISFINSSFFCTITSF